MHTQSLVQCLALLGVQEVFVLISSVTNSIGVEVTMCDNASTLYCALPHPNTLEQSMEILEPLLNAPRKVS